MAQHEIPLGDIQFANIHFRSDVLADALRQFVIHGSQRGSISVDDLVLVRREGTANTPFRTVAEALESGTRLFDALAYFSLPPDQRRPVAVRALRPGDSDPNITDISRAVFFVFMWILIRGSSPSSEQANNTAPVPRFLPSVMGLTEPPHVYVRRIASFDLSRMHHQWVKSVDLRGVGPEVQNRLALGVAGYRLPTALSILPLRDDLDPALIGPINAVKRFISRGMVWSCVGHTRSTLFLERVKNFNKNIGNLIVKAGREDAIQRLVELRVLFEAPRFDERFMEHMYWTDETFADFVDYVFPQEQ